MRFDICGTRYKDKGWVVSKRGTEGEKKCLDCAAIKILEPLWLANEMKQQHQAATRLYQ